MAQTDLNVVTTQKQRLRKTTFQNIQPYLLCVPSFVVPVFIVGAFFLGVYYSLTDFDLRYGIRNYVGLGNYIRLFTEDRAFWGSVWTSIRYALACLIIQIPLGLAVSLALDKVGAFGRIGRSLILAPLVIPPVVAALMWKIMMGPTQGILNYMLMGVGLPPVDWLGDATMALYSLVIVDVWIYTPFVILVMSAGLQSLPKTPYEAAAVDGASPLFTFWKLTLPMMRPFILIVLIFRALDALRIFDTIYATTKGGPMKVTTTLTIMGFENSFRWSKLGMGMACMIIAWLLCFVVSKRLVRFMPK
jgi:multiple sugar transport system permease protein